ncbi:hypothetical protein [Sulfobacillus sp. hq2]|uniref:hypothetical protein n=1 Tax=Sulfobacillus TaxID=28033 RepID=UPI000CCFEF13|nr:hypothetical protein [Sulfobacillus sp. hq2]POB12340.1 hypothetical protein CO251_00005 [Sulfobacillus sp. hq2]
MRDPARIAPMLALMAEIWHRHPDWRLGQLLVNVASASGPVDLFLVEDDRWAELLAQWAKKS